MLKNLLDIKDLSQTQILQLLDSADTMLATTSNSLAGKTVAMLFFENSTRTRCSFEIAAKNLGANVINLGINTSATQKGETILDTLLTLEAMGVDAFVIRHSQDYLPEMLAKHVKIAILNAGDGVNQHPTQALLDMATIRKHKKTFQKLSVAIVGDIVHSRVAHSDIDALKILGVEDIRLIGPKTLLPKGAKAYDIKTGLNDADVIITLRLQKERMQQANFPDEKKYHHAFGLTTERVKLAKPDAIIMHPGPVNRGVEITDEVADGPQSVILEQVAYGVAMRMVALENALKTA